MTSEPLTQPPGAGEGTDLEAMQPEGPSRPAWGRLWILTPHRSRTLSGAQEDEWPGSRDLDYVGAQRDPPPSAPTGPCPCSSHPLTTFS